MFCLSVFSVRKRTIARLAGEFYLSQSAQSSLSIFAHCFESTERLRHTENTEASPPAPLRMERGVITEIPLHVLQMFSGPFPISSRPIGVTSHTTLLSIRRGVGGEAAVSSVREKTPQQLSSVLSLTVGAFYFSQKNTEEQISQRCTETLSQPISQNVTAKGGCWVLGVRC